MIMQKQEAQVLSSRVLSITLFLTTMVILIPLVFHFGISLKPDTMLAKNGQVFFKQEDFSNKKTMNLTGEWAFFERRLVEPQNIQNQLSDANFIQGDGGWKLSGRGTNTVEGYGTYHLTVHLPPSELDLAIRIPQIESAYKLFINDKLMASGGHVAVSKNEGKPGFHPTIVTVPKNVERFSLTIQVSNFHSAWGGMWAPIVIGEVNSVYAIQRDLTALSMFIIGALIVTTAFYLIQYYFRPIEKVQLVFSCLCLVFFFREFTIEHMHFVLHFFGISFTAALKLNYLTFYIGTPTFLYFMQLCFPTVFDIKHCRIFYAVSGGFSLFVLLSPTRLIGYSLVSYEAICLVLMLYIVVCMVIANKTKQPTAKMMAFSSIVLTLFAVNDMLYAIDVVSTGRLLSLGIVGFIICQSYVISKRFNYIINHNETLSATLQQRNSELQQLSVELENKVEIRTKELEIANLELSKLASIDKLTGLLNRHGLQPHLQHAVEKLRRNQEPSSIVLFDFDYFKYINDSFGHDVGDKVLVLGAQIIEGNIREQDKLARWGGEEFLVCLPDTDVDGAMAIADKLRVAIEQNLSKTIDLDTPVTISGGVAEFKQGETFAALFKRADNALYKGKRIGRNCIQC